MASSDLDPLFDQWVDEARSTPIEEMLNRLQIRLKRNGRDLTGPCPLGCSENDGFVISPNKSEQHRQFFCRRSGVGGDVIAMVQHVNGTDFLGAVEMITGRPSPKGGQSSPAIDPAIARERREELRDQRIAREREERKQDSRATNSSLELWKMGKPYAGSPAEAYLRNRGISLAGDLTSNLRFIPSLDYLGFADAKAEEQTKLGAFPCMIAAIRNVMGEVIAVHRTYLDPKQPIKLSPPGDKTRNAAKKVMGRPKGGMIRFGPISEVLAIGEGIETVASWYNLGIYSGECGIAAAYSLGNMAGGSTETLPHPTKPRVVIPNGEPDASKPGVVLPEEVKTVILIGDGDSDPVSTRAFLLTGARRYRAEGREVLVCMAPDKADFNDLLLENLK